MTRLFLLLLTIFGPGTPQLACGQQAKDAAGALTATAEIVEMKFCAGTPSGLFIARELAPDAVSLNLRTRVSFRNGGAAPLILLIENDKRIVLSLSLKGAESHEDQLVIPYYEYLGPKRRYTPEELPALASEQPGEPFQIIPPEGAWTDDAFSLSFQVHKPSVNDAGERTGSELLGKAVFFQMELEPALPPDSFARDLQTAWRSYGALFVGKLRTQPIRIAIPQSPAASRCASNFHID